MSWRVVGSVEEEGEWCRRTESSSSPLKGDFRRWGYQRDDRNEDTSRRLGGQQQRLLASVRNHLHQ